MEKLVILNRIREFRAREDLTQEELAMRVGVTRQTIISIEKGEYIPSLALGMKLAETFRCTVEHLFAFNHSS